MSSWSNATITQKGYALQAKLTANGESLHITKAVGGSGRVTAGQLVSQTAITGPVQLLQVEVFTYNSENETASLKVLLSNLELQNGYTLNQIGIFAEDPDDGEVLYAIAQVDVGESIPSITTQPAGFTCEWEFHFAFTNAGNIEITIDPDSFLTSSAGDNRYVSKEAFENTPSVVIVPVGENIPVEERKENSVYLIMQ